MEEGCGQAGMKTTVVTICWNAERTLARCVRSLLGQTCRPEEHLVVDGGSTDGTLAVLAGLEQEYAVAGVALRVLNQERRPGEAGIPSAWNQGLANARGDLIALLNSDDWYEPTALEQVQAAFAQAPAPGPAMVVAPVNLVRPGGETARTLYPKCLWLAEVLMPLPHPGCFVRREVYFSQVGLFDCRYRISADYDFVWRCRKARVAMAYLAKPLVNMEMGGLANRSRRLARRETLAIACRHSRCPAPALAAWAVRTLAGI